MSDPYKTVHMLHQKAFAAFDRAAQGNRNLNQYKGFIYLGQGRQLEALILRQEGDLLLSESSFKKAKEAFEDAYDRAGSLGGNYRAQAERFLAKLQKDIQGNAR